MQKSISDPIIRLLVSISIAFSIVFALKLESDSRAIPPPPTSYWVRDSLRFIRSKEQSAWDTKLYYGCNFDNGNRMKKIRKSITAWDKEFKNGEQKKFVKVGQSFIVNIEYYDTYFDKDSCKELGLEPGDGGMVMALLRGANQDCIEHLICVSRSYLPNYLKASMKINKQNGTFYCDCPYPRKRIQEPK